MRCLASAASIAAVLALLPCVAAQATTEYTSQVTFEAAFAGLAGPNLGVESFETLTVTNTPGAGPAVTSSMTVSVTSGVMGVYNQNLTTTSGWHATDLSNYLMLGSFPPPTAAVVATITLVDPSIAFGMTYTDWGDFGGGELEFTNDAGDSFIVAVTPQSNANEMFYGVINPNFEFTQVTLTTTAKGEAYSIDELLFGRCTSNWDVSIGGFTGSPTGGLVTSSLVFNGELYVGGFFTAAGGVPANYIARWDGSSWNALGTGVSGGGSTSIHTMVEFNGDLYVGGLFDTAGGAPADNVARWNGSSWSNLGSGLGGPTNDAVLALGVFAGELYAGGFFSGNLRKWNPGPQTWTAVGGGIQGDGGNFEGVEVLAVLNDGSGNELFAGGQFIGAGGSPANRIAKWDGINWSALGSGVAGGTTHPKIRVLEAFNGEIYVGGEFATAGGGSAKDLARWNGTTWASVPGTLSGGAFGILSMEVHDDGTGSALFAGGSHLTAGGLPINYVGRWDGVSWSALDGGVNGWVEALTEHDDGSGPALYVGGRFFNADGQAANRFARWKPCQ